MKTRWLIVVAAVVVGLCAAAASASNMAFAFRVQLGGGGQQELRFVALPYLYEPTTAEELCADLGGSEVVAEVLRWDEAASQFVVHPCGTGTEDFALAEGMAYGVRNVSGEVIEGLLVGRHDPGFSLDLPAGPGSNLSWISPPCTSPPFDDVPCWK